MRTCACTMRPSSYLLPARLLDDLQVLEDAFGGELDSFATLSNRCELLVLIFVTLLRLLRLGGSGCSFRNKCSLILALESLGILIIRSVVSMW